ncbi:TIGR01244 family sulfur transferase [Sphingomonas nostoxanthinifaciens]|uniref:TIGR01244 family sulfur transferase n=1 Tax=Sphingomonas nostoxanthinifaciens TaxID=2872652 RepID=UPI001CC21471|nr:TIGR01244 family sulfur transferase [Sphingomonas nostoxanthinifaciens]UAK22999.1 TIGR01244 family phosphatase [Sphingomonas nostoxanthinifaciens]
MFRSIDDTISVSVQISPGEVAAAKAQGFTTIINNRPDDEQPGQPRGAEIAAAAQAAGLAYVAIPVDHSGFSEPQVVAMADALAAADGPVLAFCRSGTRSTFLWALARGRMGDDGDALIAKAANAGYDISPLRAILSA